MNSALRARGHAGPRILQGKGSVVVGKLMAVVLLALVGCGVKDEKSVPGLVVTCPNPADRGRLVEGATYRDLASSRAEAFSGWRQCHDALRISQE